MEPQTERQDGSRLERFLSRLRQAPPEKRRAYALAGAAAVTAGFVVLAIVWQSVAVRDDGVPLSAALADTFSSMRAAFTSQK